VAPAADRVGNRGRYFTIEQATVLYPVFTDRLLRRLVELHEALRYGPTLGQLHCLQQGRRSDCLGGS
jgi:hypothetical protein